MLTPRRSSRDFHRGVLDLAKMLKDEPAVSPHGGTSPVENFAEVYAIYRRDPAWLEKSNPKASQWMRSNYP